MSTRNGGRLARRYTPLHLAHLTEHFQDNICHHIFKDLPIFAKFLQKNHFFFLTEQPNLKIELVLKNDRDYQTIVCVMLI